MSVQSKPERALAIANDIHTGRLDCIGKPACAYCLALGARHLERLAARLSFLGYRNCKFFCDKKSKYYVLLPGLTLEEGSALLRRIKPEIPPVQLVTVYEEQMGEEIQEVAEAHQFYDGSLLLPQEKTAVGRLANYQGHINDQRVIGKVMGIRADWLSLLDRLNREYNIPLSYQGELGCRECEGTGMTVSPEEEDRLAYLRSLRPLPDWSLAQYHVRIPDLVRRVKFILRHDRIEDARICVVGDDDLVSVALCEIACPERIIVFDKDPRVIRVLRTIALERRFPITAIQFDIDDLSTTTAAAVVDGVRPVDLFITDPPYSSVGLRAFSYLGMRLLKAGGVGYIAYPTLSDFERWAVPVMNDVEQFITGSGFIITDMLNSFHAYESEAAMTSGVMRIQAWQQEKSQLKKPKWAGVQLYGSADGRYERVRRATEYL